MVTGTLGSRDISDGRLRGDQIRFTVGAVEYTGTVAGDRNEGMVRGGAPAGAFTARRAN